MRVYVAGPMTGLPKFNYPAFAAAEAELRAAGFEVESPHHNGDDDTSRAWEWYMRAGLRQMLACDGVALLPGWRESRGAKLEAQTAAATGMSVAPLEAWLVVASLRAGR